jgi:ribosomal protein L37AE/L43A
MREQEIVHECPGCRRLVKVVLQIEGIPRCDDCALVVSDKDNQFWKAGLS